MATVRGRASWPALEKPSERAPSGLTSRPTLVQCLLMDLDSFKLVISRATEQGGLNFSVDFDFRLGLRLELLGRGSRLEIRLGPALGLGPRRLGLRCTL